ncbi:MAG: SusC/RagA family TonB-linked outer membrane protein [Prevotellaceae bacterium]|jgi:TonB-linked SusC/RagA family outer membrane protein|nr:SusC/RagA family TonB-linked outer membrane protein [Prevotellaceae bacterium]
MSKKSFFNLIMVRKILLSACVMCALAFGAFAQGVTVNGTVTETSGDPLANVSITVKGSTVGVVSNEAGQYSIRVPDGNAILVFSFVGFTSQEISVGNKTTIDVVMSEDVQQISEVVVVGYGTLERKHLTNSITSISSKDLPVGVAGATITNALKGKVSNLIIQETPSPNSETTLQLRGMASVNTKHDPLVVIDGMPGGDIRSVVQEDIQSIDILKDASAGAIYGTRAAGGVILITTKQAKEGKMRLSYTGEAILKKNFGKPRVLTADEYRFYKPAQNDYGDSADWWDEGMAANPTSQRHVVTIQGGAESARIYASAMYEDNRGVLMGDNRKDYGGRINGSFKLVDGWLDVNTHIDYRRANRNQASPSVDALVTSNPTHSPHATDWVTHGSGMTENVIRDATLKTDEGIDTWFRPDVELKLNILPIEGLAYHQTIGYENSQWEWHNYQPSNSTQTEYNNRSGKGTAELKFEKTELLNYDGYFSYVRNVGGKHYINASAGYNYFERNKETFRLRNFDFAEDAFKMWDMGKGTGLNNASATHKAEMGSSKDITQKLLAAFGRVNYAYLDRYLASATFRREGSSKFAVNRRWGNFWQLSGAWRLSKENFMQDLGWLNDLKVRVAYGVTGNEGFDADYAAVMYGSAGNQVMLPDGTWGYPFGVSKNINPELGWEEKHEWNIGVDYELFDRRIFGKIDFYSRNVEGLIYEVDVPQPPYIQPKMFKNIGTLKNKGWEFEIGANIVQTKDLNYTTRLTLSHNTTTIGSLWGDKTYMNGGVGIGRAGVVHRIEENSTVGSFFIYKHAGFDANGRFQAYDRDGNIIVPELDGQSEDDRQYLGNYTPTVIAGWSHNLTWKNWSLGMTLTSWIDYDIYNAVDHVLGTTGGTPAESRNVLLDLYTRNAAIKGQTMASDYFLQDGTFLKIQNLTLAYTLKMKQYLKVMESARVYFTANNLYTFTGYRGLNPEVDITGWTGGVEQHTIYPQTRTFTFGIQLNF